MTKPLLERRKKSSYDHQFEQLLAELQAQLTEIKHDEKASLQRAIEAMIKSLQDFPHEALNQGKWDNSFLIKILAMEDVLKLLKEPNSSLGKWTKQYHYKDPESQKFWRLQVKPIVESIIISSAILALVVAPAIMVSPLILFGLFFAVPLAITSLILGARHTFEAGRESFKEERLTVEIETKAHNDSAALATQVTSIKNTFFSPKATVVVPPESPKSRAETSLEKEPVNVNDGNGLNPC